MRIDVVTGGSAVTPTSEATAEQAAHRTLNGVLDLPGLATAAAPVLAPSLGRAMFALVAPLGTIASAATLGSRLLDVASTVIARSEPSISDVIGPAGEPPPTPAGNPPPQPWPSIIGDLVADLIDEQTPGSPDANEAQRVLRDIGLAVFDLQSLAIVTPRTRIIPEEIVRRTEHEIVKRMKKLEKLWQKLEKFFPSLTAPRLRKVLLELYEELENTAPYRAIIAAFMAVPGIFVDVVTGVGLMGREVKSTSALGNEVHARLQRAYRSFWTSSRFIARGRLPFIRGVIVQDGLVYRNVMSLGTKLADAANASKDGSLQALVFAREPAPLVSSYVRSETLASWMFDEYREDTLDMRIGQLWEIKPMRSAALAVYQEIHYRYGFNLTNALLQDVADVIRAGGGTRGRMSKRTIFFKAIAYHSWEGSLTPGLDLNWSSLKQPFTVGEKGARPLLTVPLTVPQLPGVLLYMLLDIPIAGLLALSPVLADAIQKQIEKWTREYADDVEEILAALARLAMAILSVLAIVVLAFLFWEALAGVAAALPALAQLLLLAGPSLPALSVPDIPPGGGSMAQELEPPASGAFVQKLLEAARAAQLTPISSPRMIGEELLVQLAPASDVGASSIPIIEFAIGPLRICDMPVTARPIIDVLAQTAAAVAAGAFTKFLGPTPKQT